MLYIFKILQIYIAMLKIYIYQNANFTIPMQKKYLNNCWNYETAFLAQVILRILH